MKLTPIETPFGSGTIGELTTLKEYRTMLTHTSKQDPLRPNLLLVGLSPGCPCTECASRHVWEIEHDRKRLEGRTKGLTYALWFGRITFVIGLVAAYLVPALFGSLVALGWATHRARVLRDKDLKKLASLSPAPMKALPARTR